MHLHDTAWMDRGACNGYEDSLFFPEKPTLPERLEMTVSERHISDCTYEYQVRLAKRICRSQCEVRGDCLAYAVLTGQDDGIWGGLTKRERRKVEKERQRRKRVA